MTVAPADTVTFLLTPLREGRHAVIDIALDGDIISTHAPAGGATPAGRSRCRPEASYFYSRPCGRDDENVQHKIRIHHDFYSRPCGRGDHDWPATGDFELLFLLTPLREGRRIVDNNVDVLAEFLLTPLREGRPLHRRRSMRSACYFYSRPCGRGDAYDPDVITDGCISTHAPAGGATYPGHRRLLYIYNFYSRPCGRGDKKEASDARRLCEFLLTPLREGRLKKADASGKPTIFLLTPCGRGDQILLPGARAADDISTHAPAGGATKASRRVIHPIPISTHAPAGGATKKADASGKPTIFLLTPLREGRLRNLREMLCKELISTHAPAGGATLLLALSSSCVSISTHAPAGGATFMQHRRNEIREISTHAPAGGATFVVRSQPRSLLISTHAPAGGATLPWMGSAYPGGVFLLTPLREGRQQACRACRGRQDFYSRPCGRGDITRGSCLTG